MITLVTDDNPTIVQSVIKILRRIDPDGTHLAATSGARALELAGSNPIDVAFLDVEMPGINGLDLAKQLQELRPTTNVVFVTGYAEYAINAFELYASGYLLKPVTEAEVRGALEHLRHKLGPQEQRALPVVKVQCFGFFEAWCNGKPIRFGRNRTKMLFAYLIDRNGAMCDTQQLMGALWPDDPNTTSHANQLRVFVSDLQTTLTQLGMGKVLVRRRGEVGINKEFVDCDYYRYLAGDPTARHQFRGEYMSQYHFGEATLEALLQK